MQSSVSVYAMHVCHPINFIFSCPVSVIDPLGLCRVCLTLVTAVFLHHDPLPARPPPPVSVFSSAAARPHSSQLARCRISQTLQQIHSTLRITDQQPPYFLERGKLSQKYPETFNANKLPEQ